MTKRTKTGLNEKQFTALPLVLAGKRDAEIAEQVGVTRQTVSKWRNRDPRFIAALNEERLTMLQAAQARIESLAGSALDTLEKAVKGGDLRAALHVLKVVGLDEPTTETLGAIDARELVHDWAKEEAETYIQDDSFSDLFGAFNGTDERRRKYAALRVAEMVKEWNLGEDPEADKLLAMERLDKPRDPTTAELIKAAKELD